MTRQELANRLFELTGQSVKPTSYTKARFEELIAQATPPSASDQSEDPTPQGGEYEAPHVDAETCPLCGHSDEASKFTSPGDPGTPLGACLECPECKELFNAFSRVAVPMPKAKKPRKVLNPQSTIDKKADHLKKKTGADLFYDRVERLWTLHLKGDEDDVYITSKVLSETSKEQLVKMFEKRERSPQI